MVKSNTGVQDPDKTEDQLPSTDSNGLIIVSDDDLDEETVGSHHYELLSTDDFAESESHTSSENESNDNANGLPSITPIEEVLVKELWSLSTPKEVDIEMDSKKIDEVKQVMMNVTLPTTAFPEWANSVPEESWKMIILNRLKKD